MKQCGFFTPPVAKTDFWLIWLSVASLELWHRWNCEWFAWYVSLLNDGKWLLSDYNLVVVFCYDLRLINGNIADGESTIYGFVRFEKVVPIERGADK